MALTIVSLAAVLVAVGCGGADTSSERLRISLTAPIKPSDVQTIFGPVHYGAEFGLDIAPDDFLTFESHATATQSVLAGETAIVGGSFVSNLLLREIGQDFKSFCPFSNLDDYVIAGRGGVNRVEQLFDPNVRVAIDSPGGAGGVALNAMLKAAGVDRTVADVPNLRILESSGLRASVFVAGEVDMTALHLVQLRQLREQIPDAVAISSLYEDAPLFIKKAYAARTQWLDENQELAGAFCASVLKASRELPEDFDLFVSAVNQFVGEPPNEEVLREIFDIISTYNFWPKNGGLDPESILFMAELGQLGGLLKNKPNPEEVVDRRPLKRALELLGGRVE